jgi:hypothetical protein
MMNHVKAHWLVSKGRPVRGWFAQGIGCVEMTTYQGGERHQVWLVV